MASDFTKSPNEILVDLINSTNDTNYAANLFLFAAPDAVANGHVSGCNTEVVVTGSVSSTWTGEIKFYYNRVVLNSVPGSRSVEFNMVNGLNLLSELIQLINDRYGINITSDDYTDAELPVVNAGQSINYDVVVLSTALVFTGPLSVVLKRENGGESLIPLSSIITTTTLNLFTYTPL